MTVADLVWEVNAFYGQRKGTQKQTAEKFGLNLTDTRKTVQILGYKGTVLPPNALKKVIIKEKDFPFLNKYI